MNSKTPQEQPMYTIEVFSDGSRNPEDVKKDILADTGMTPSVHDHGTHYVINHKISLETLERIQKYTDVQEIKGEYPAARRFKWSLRTNAENAIMADGGRCYSHEEHLRRLGLIV